MPSNLYFRIRENGAGVYRIDTENRQQRLDMKPIATANIRSGEIKPQGQTVLTAAERNEIEKWMVARRKELGARESEDIRRLIDQLNLTAQWVQSKATDSQLETFSEDLLMAMHDLRGTLVRRRADRG